MDYRVISTDNHIIEPPNAFVDHLPREFRDRAPRILRGPDGGDGPDGGGAGDGATGPTGHGGGGTRSARERQRCDHRLVYAGAVCAVGQSDVVETRDLAAQ